MFPAQLDIEQFSRTGKSFSGTLQTTDMLRLQDALVEKPMLVEVALHTGIDEEKYRYLKGHFSTECVQICQRCLKPFTSMIAADFALAVIAREQEAKKLPAYYEPVVVTGKAVNVTDIIEDEILLNLPLVAMHAPEDCGVELTQISSDNSSENDLMNPFNVLRQLKLDRKE